MASHSVEVYVSFVDENATKALLNSVLGVSDSVMVTVGSLKFCGTQMSDAQLASFKASIGTIASAKWYQSENAEMFSRRLLDTNVSPSYVDCYWTLRQNEAANTGAAITIRRDIVYASPNGISSNLGTEASPVDAVTALLRTPCKAEREIRFLAGTYTINQAIAFYGDNLIVTTASGKMDVRLEFGDGAHFRVYANSINWRHLELAGTFGLREFESEDANEPSIVEHLPLFEVYGDTTEISHCFIHDFQNIGWWAGVGGVLEECLIQNIGWLNLTRGHGHNYYSQHIDNEATRIMRRCVLMPAFGGGLRLYGSTPDTTLRNYRIEDVTHIEDDALFGGSSPLTNVSVERNWWLNCAWQAGYDEDAANGTMSIQNSKIVSLDKPIRMNILNFDDITFRQNQIICYDYRLDVGTPHYLFVGHGIPSAIDWNDNQHFVEDNALRYEWELGHGTYPQFNQNAFGGGINADSSFSSALPSTNTIEIVPCSEGWLAIIRVLNLSELDSVNVDLSSLGLSLGASYRLRSAYDYLGDVIEFEYDGLPIEIDMRVSERSQIKPYGYESYLATIQTWFGCWVLEVV